MKKLLYTGFFLCTIFFSTNIVPSEVISQPLECKKQITITIPLKNDELLYADSLALEVDHPAFVIKDITPTQQPISVYDSASKENKKVFENQVTVTATIEYQPSLKIDNAHVHVVYTTNKQPYPLEKLIPLSFENNVQKETQDQTISPVPQKVQKQSTPKKTSPSFSEYISYLLKTSNSLTFQLLLAFLLGILLSLTPCVYPMIPITVGILHSYGTKSFFGNATRAILYSMGIATTYALFGLVASCTGPLCGYVLSKPIFVYMLVAFLAYLAGSMLGLYELYIPRFMQIQQQKLQAHSLWSIFLFGVMSGTIASPCVSPGLALILGVAATLANKFLGFLLLFLFGIGLSMPLLIVGTFSSSLTLLPRAGVWMVEIKKVFGFLLLALCIYYLTTILPHNIILLISAITVASSGILYLWWAQKMYKKSWKKGYNIIGTLLIAGSVTLFVKAAQETLFPSKSAESRLWLKDLDQAFIIAQQQNKLIFVDIWAQFCSICVAINNSILADETVLQAFKENYILLKVNGTSPTSEPYATLQQRYNITGFPTFLIINPHTQEVVEKLGSEIYTMPKEDVVEKMRNIARKN